MPIPESYRTLVPRILENTLKDNIHWEVSSSEWTFVTTFGKYGLSVMDSGSPDGTTYTLTLFDSEGVAIDSFDVEAQEQWREDTFIPGNDFTPIEELWAAARRQARGVTDALKAIEGELDHIEAPVETFEDPPFE